MSILPLGFATSIAVSMLSVPIAVTDVSYNAVNGIDRQTIDATRTIDAAVDASNSRRIEQIFGGSVSDGSIMIYITDEDVELYFIDIYAEGTSRRQSFVVYGRYQYRVTTVADWTAQAGMKIYLAERHITQDLV